MTLRRAAVRAGLLAWLGLACAVMPLAAHANTPADAYYERTVMSVADARCRLFTPEIASALSAARAQARGAALRAGADGASLRAPRRAGAAEGPGHRLRFV